LLGHYHDDEQHGGPGNDKIDGHGGWDEQWGGNGDDTMKVLW
jgi:Ca2+-binding RTX toxin-like protein